MCCMYTCDDVRVHVCVHIFNMLEIVSEENTGSDPFDIPSWTILFSSPL